MRTEMRRKVHPWMRIKRMAKFPDGFIKIWEVKWRAGVVHWPPVSSSTHLQFNKHFSGAINNGKWTIRAGHSDISPVGIFQWETLKCSSGGGEWRGLGAASEFAMNWGESERWPLLFSLPEFNTLTPHSAQNARVNSPDNIKIGINW